MTKAEAIVWLLWAMSRPRGVRQWEIVQHLDRQRNGGVNERTGANDERTIRRYIRTLREMGFEIDNDVEDSPHRRYVLMNADLTIDNPDPEWVP